jgi:hypothetical protein
MLKQLFEEILRLIAGLRPGPVAYAQSSCGLRGARHMMSARISAQCRRGCPLSWATRMPLCESCQQVGPDG